MREQKERRDFDYQLPELGAVRTAICSALSDVSEPRIRLRPLRFEVSLKTADRAEQLDLGRLSGGYRAVLALVMDLARRMAQGNPQYGNPLESEAIVLIDEVDLHLHPSWQQRILGDLTRTFPNAQFIVSTHSPQVLTTVKPEQVVSLRLEDGRLAARAPDWGTWGAEAGDVLAVVMGVKERPVNEFSEMLTRYRGLVAQGNGEGEEARRLRAMLDGIAPGDPALARADLEIPATQAVPHARERAVKRIRPVSALTAGLADYLATAIAADWEGFGSHCSGASLRELRACLTRNQHGLCAYCEIEVKPLPGQSQIEHVVPRSEPARGKAKALDITNLVACCLGGSKRKSGSSRRPHRSGLSCGQAKAELSDPDFVDPRTLPTAPSLLSVGYDGRLEADAAACQSAGWRPARIRRTVAVSNLNTERLRPGA